MINNISLHNFKCFREKQEIPLSQITIMYGKNGRGKSTVAQALLLVGQTMKKQNAIDPLQLIGEMVQMGNYEEVRSVLSEKTDIMGIGIKTKTEKLEMGFGAYEGKIQLAKLKSLRFNDENRFEPKSTTDGDSDSQQFTGALSDIKILQDLKDVSYVSANRFGPQNSVLRDDNLLPDWIGVRGEHVINILSNKGAEFIKEVEHHLSSILSGAALQVSNANSDYLELLMNSVDGSTCFRPVNVGFGYSFVLPVIVSTLLAKKGSLLIIENPEAHLHPGAQSRLMKFLIEESLKNNLQLIVETHSDHVVNGLRIAMKQSVMGIKPQDAQIVFFSHDNSDTQPQVSIIYCDRYGELSEYPDDFLDEWTKQLVKLI